MRWSSRFQLTARCDKTRQSYGVFCVILGVIWLSNSILFTIYSNSFYSFYVMGSWYDVTTFYFTRQICLLRGIRCWKPFFSFSNIQSIEIHCDLILSVGQYKTHILFQCITKWNSTHPHLFTPTHTNSTTPSSSHSPNK